MPYATVFPEPYPLNFDPEQFRWMIYSHPARQHIRWFRAAQNPVFDPARKFSPTASSTVPDTYVHIEQSTEGVMAIVIVDGIQMRYGQTGQYQSGSATFIAMPDEIPASTHDWIIPQGNRDIGYPNYPTFRTTETLKVGVNAIPQTGTITASNTTITGVGTTFTQNFRDGDLIVANNASYACVVSSVVSDTHITVVSGPSISWNAMPFWKAVETLIYQPFTSIDEIRSSTSAFDPSTYEVSADGMHVQWLSHSTRPAVGTSYSILYRYAPKYVVLPDVATQGIYEMGVGTYLALRLRLWQPETYKT